jgi:hypothetical protein
VETCISGSSWRRIRPWESQSVDTRNGTKRDRKRYYLVFVKPKITDIRKLSLTFGEHFIHLVENSAA